MKLKSIIFTSIALLALTATAPLAQLRSEVLLDRQAFGPSVLVTGIGHDSDRCMDQSGCWGGVPFNAPLESGVTVRQMMMTFTTGGGDKVNLSIRYQPSGTYFTETVQFSVDRLALVEGLRQIGAIP